MKKLKLKKHKNFTKKKILIITISTIIVMALILSLKLGKRINKKILKYSEIEVTKISKIIVNEAVTEEIAKKININDLFIIEKNSNGNIQMIDFDSNVFNDIISSINKNVYKYFKELETGNSSIINTKQNLITNTNIISNKKGIVFEIPMGVMMNNSFLSNLGPKIPVKVSLNGDIDSEIQTSIESYGINNAILKIYIKLRVSEQIILPLISKKIEITSSIPIAIKMVQGLIPDYYFDGSKTTSSKNT